MRFKEKIISNKKADKSQKFVLAIDIGNSQYKWELSQKKCSIDSGVETNFVKPSSNFIAAKKLSNKVLIANVAGENKLLKIFKIIGNNDITIIKAKKNFYGLINNYSNPKTLGVDRLLAMLGLIETDQFKQHCRLQKLKKQNQFNILIVSGGSAITIDYWSIKIDNKIFQYIFNGGQILPGIQLMTSSLNQATADLPEISINNYSGKIINRLFGKSTDVSIALGILTSVGAAIEKLYHKSKLSNQPISTIYVTGGDANLISKNIDIKKNQIKTINNLVLKGINKIATIEY